MFFFEFVLTYEKVINISKIESEYIEFSEFTNQETVLFFFGFYSSIEVLNSIPNLEIISKNHNCEINK